MMLLFFLNLIFISEVISFLSSVSFYLALIFGLLIGLKLVFFEKKLNFSFNSFCYLIFLIFSFFSVVFSFDKEQSIKYFLIYLAGFFFYLEAERQDNFFDNYLLSFLKGVFLFSLFLFSLNWFFQLNLFDDPKTIFYQDYFHNHIGDLMVLAFFSGLKIFYPLFFLFFIFSYGRGAYLSFILTQVFIFFQKKKIDLKKTFLLFFIFIFFLITSSQVRQLMPTFWQNFLTQRLKIAKEKDIWGKRDVYLNHSLKSIKERFFWGVGPGNFEYISRLYQVNFGESTTTAHNIFLDIFSENGFFAFVFFAFFVFLVIKKLKRNFLSYMFLSLTIIFLTDFIYRHYFFFFLWLILAGRLVKQEKSVSFNSYFILFLVVPFFIISQIIFLSEFFFLKRDDKTSIKIFPFKQQAYDNLISKKIKQGKTLEALSLLDIYKKNFSFNSYTYYRCFFYYQILNKDKEKNDCLINAFLKEPFNLAFLEEKKELIKNNPQMVEILKDFLKKLPKDSYLHQFLVDFVSDKKS